jgi:hypothetical protein
MIEERDQFRKQILIVSIQRIETIARVLISLYLN